MGNRVWLKMAFVLLWPALFLFAGNIQAASLQKIEVASHLGEPFFAEVPLKLEANELASKVFIDIAAPSDYKIFEVYRDPVLKSIRADVASDKRGVRVKLSSRSRIKSPFFNLVLKIRYGRVSHFKKFPVFLDAAKSTGQAATKAPQPSVEALKQPAAAILPRTSLTKSAGQAIIPAPTTTPKPAVKPAPEYYEGWARTDRYGPIVRGDTLSTVAERLRVDYRYTRNQIMLALFEKNSDSFDKNNINLLKAGSRLNVPTAAEIEEHSKAEASRFLAKQEKNWKKLTQQPRYAAEKEAQRTRYTKRISVGEHADGVASAPVAIAEAAKPTDNSHTPQGKLQPESDTELTTASAETTPASPVDATAEQATSLAESAAAVTQAQAESSKILKDLRQQNSLLQEQLVGNQKSIEALSRTVENDGTTAAAAKARLEKLEIMIARLQSELEKMNQQQPASLSTGMDWVIWLLIALVVLLLGIVAMMMRREPAHPAVSAEPKSDDEPVQTAEAGKDDALAAVIENEVAGIETGESDIPLARETATIDSLPVFTDELSDTDTAELEPFDADSEAEPDPDIDYLAEADVYIRYGMEDEAIKQLDMALRLQPDHVEAHIRKAELLLGKSDQPGLDESIAAATMTLTAANLDRFKSSIEKLGAEAGQKAPEPSIQQQQETFEQAAQDTLPLDESTIDNLDFDLSDLDVPDIEGDKQQDEQAHVDAADDHETEEMSWLHDVAFDEEIQPDDEPVTAQPSDIEASATLGMDNLLSEFPNDENDQASVDQAVAADQPDVTSTETLPDFDVLGGATQELDHLLSEFSDQDTVEAETVDEPETADEPAGATRRLDQLLSEFDDEDDPFAVAGTAGGLDEAVFESVESESVESKQNETQTDAATSGTIGTETDHGATQELDNLLAEFSDAEEDQVILGSETNELDASFFETEQSPVQHVDDDSGADVDHGATQELDHLLSAFSNQEEQTIDIDQTGLATEDFEDAQTGEHGATQVLGHLLDEFSDDALKKDDEEDDKKS